MTSFYLGFLVRRQENAFYKLCKREIVLSNMGEGALRSHANGKKHQTKVMDLEMARNFFKPKTTSAEVKKQSKNLTNVLITSSSKNCEATQPSVTAIASSSKTSIDVCFQGSFVQKAEIMQVLKQVYSGLSDNSCKNVFSLFQSMLPDSQIAQKMRLEPNQLKYMVNHGIASLCERYFER